MIRRAALVAALTAVAALGGVVAQASAKVPYFKHVFVVVLENENASATFGPNSQAPYLAQTLKNKGAYVPNYYGIAHNSLGNYVAMVSGQSPNIQTQADCQVYNDITPGTRTADGQVLGRLAAQVARILRGKHKPIFAPHMDTGDFVVIVNAEKVAVAQSKRDNEFVYRHSGYPGGLRKRSVGEMIESHPDRLVEKAVKGMLPKNRLGRAMAKKLKVYAGPEHPHAAQKPVAFEITQVAQ